MPGNPHPSELDVDLREKGTIDPRAREPAEVGDCYLGCNLLSRIDPAKFLQSVQGMRCTRFTPKLSFLFLFFTLKAKGRLYFYLKNIPIQFESNFAAAEVVNTKTGEFIIQQLYKLKPMKLIT